MKNYVLGFTVLVGIFFSGDSSAQNVALEWAKGIGAPENSASCDINSRRLAVDSRNNIYSGGTLFSFVNGSISFGGGVVANNVTNGNGFIAKQDAQGNFIWAKHFAEGEPSPDVDPWMYYAMGWVQEVALDGDSNVYAIGSFVGTMVMDPGDTLTSTVMDPFSQAQETFIVKLDSGGNFLWARQFQQVIMGIANATSLAVDKDGNVYITGNFDGTVDFNPDPVASAPLSRTGTSGNDIFICKLDKDGNYVWAKQMGGIASQSDGSGRSIALDALDNIYITGSFRDEIDFDPAGGNLITAGPTRDPFVCKLTSGGDFVWVRQFENTGGSGSSVGGAGEGISLDEHANIIVTGNFYGTISFDANTSFNAQGTNTNDMFVAKLDSAGNLTWAKHMGGTGSVSPNTVIADAFGNIYSSGLLSGGNADFDPGPDPHMLTPVGGNQNTFVSKLDKDGNFLYAFQLEGNNNTGKAIGASPGNVYLTGTFRDSIDMDPSPVQSRLYSVGNSSRYMYFANYSDCNPVDTLSGIQGNDTVCAGESYVFSTPAVSGAVSYTWELPAGWSGSSTTDSITVITGATGGDIRVTANGICDSSAPEILAVYVNVPSVSITADGDTLSTDQGGYTSWQWYLDGTAIDQATGSSHVAVANGDYTVVVTDRFGCTDTSDVHPVTHIPESVHDLASSAAVRIYPNPATRTVYVHVPVAATVRLSSAEGKTIVRQMLPAATRTPVDLSMLATGVYILNIAAGNGQLIYAGKLVKITE